MLRGGVTEPSAAGNGEGCAKFQKRDRCALVPERLSLMYKDALVLKVRHRGGGIAVDAFSVETPVVGFAGGGLILKKRPKQLCRGASSGMNADTKLKESQVGLQFFPRGGAPERRLRLIPFSFIFTEDLISILLQLQVELQRCKK